MDSKNTPFTVQLGQGASIKMGNAIINIGNSGATIQFGTTDFVDIAARTSSAPSLEVPVAAHTTRLHVTQPSPHRTCPPMHQVVPVVEASKKQTSVFERLSCRETLALKRVLTGRQTNTIPVNVAAFSVEPFAPGRHDVEASSSGGKLSRRQRRKQNAVLRARGLLPELPTIVKEPEPVSTIPTKNNLTHLKGVKRNSPTAELKKFFREQERQAPVPQKKKIDSLSSSVYNVPKIMTNEGLMKRKSEKPIVIRDREVQRRHALHGEHQGMTPGPQVRVSAIERSRQKGKQIWEPMPYEEKNLEKRNGVTSALKFFQENLPNPMVVRNEEDKVFELRKNEKSFGRNGRASVVSAVGGQHISVKPVNHSFLNAAGLQIPDFVLDGAFDTLGVRDAFRTPWGMSNRSSFGTIPMPRTSRLPMQREMLPSVRGSPLGVYKEDHFIS